METKLDLVNHLLQTVGERRVLSLETGHPSVVQAVQALDSYNKDFQGLGWWFNKNRNVTLVPNNRGEITVPSDALSFSIVQGKLQYESPPEKLRYVRRSGKVYDTWKNTYTINHDIVADLTLLLAIEDMPQVATSYLKHSAAQNYYIDDDGDNAKADRLAERTMLAWHALKAAQLKAEATNALDRPEAQRLRYRIGQMGAASNPMYPGGRYR